MASLRLDVVTPVKQVVKNTEVESVILPGKNGQMNILPGHVSLMTNLQPGTFAYLINGIWQWAVLSGGFAEISGDQLIVLAETMEISKEIDKARAELALKRARDELKEHKYGTDAHKAAIAAKARAEARLHVLHAYHLKH